MGQYYRSVSIDKQEYMDAHATGNGLKLMEHSWVGNNLMDIVMTLLSPGQPWHKTRIVWAGDYMDEGLFLEEEYTEECPDDTLYSYAGDQFTAIEPEMVMEEDCNVIVNHTMKQYCIVPQFEKDKWKPHPLSLLTCSGNGRGGGDYRIDNPYIGTWAGHEISVEKQAPEGFTEIVPNFIED